MIGKTSLIHRGNKPASKPKLPGTLVEVEARRSGSVFYNSFSWTLVVTGNPDDGFDLISVPTGQKFQVAVRSWDFNRAQIHSENTQSLIYEAKLTKGSDTFYAKELDSTFWPWVNWDSQCLEANDVDYGETPGAGADGIAGTDNVNFLLGFTTRPTSFTSCLPRGRSRAIFLMYFPEIENPGFIVPGSQVINHTVLFPEDKKFTKGSSSIVPTDDSFTNDASVGENNGSDSRLLLKNDTGQVRKTFIKFSPSIVAATKAELVLKLFADQDSGSTITVGIYEISNSWGEDTITWSNQPAFGDKINEFDVPNGSVADDEFSVDIRHWVNEKLGGNEDVSLGIQIDSPQQNFNLIFYSKENVSSVQPNLDLEFLS